MKICECEHDNVNNEVITEGEWHSNVSHNIHGDPTVKLGIDGAVMLMGLPTHHGWRAITAVKLNHQLKIEDVSNWIEENPMCREVAALAVDTGEWETIWTRKNEEPHADTR